MSCVKQSNARDTETTSSPQNESSTVSAASDDPTPHQAAAMTQTRPGEKPGASGTESRTGSGTQSGPSGSGTGSGSGSGGGMSHSDSSNGVATSRSGRKSQRKRRSERATQPASAEPATFRMPEPGSNLFVAGLASTVDDEALRWAFAPHGRVVSAKVMLHVDTAASRGFGFVLFASAAEAERAMDAVQGTAIAGHGGRLQVSVSKHRGENLTAESRVVYVRNVPAAVGRSASTLAEFFGGFGEVLRQQVSSQPDLPPRPGMKSAGPLTVAVVTFGTIEAARACVAACHGKRPFAQCVVPLLSKMEEPRTLRERRMREQRAQRPKKATAAAAVPATARRESPDSSNSTPSPAHTCDQNRAAGTPDPQPHGPTVAQRMSAAQRARASMPPPQLPPAMPWWPPFGAMPPPSMLPNMPTPPNFGPMPPSMPASGFGPGYGGPSYGGVSPWGVVPTAGPSKYPAGTYAGVAPSAAGALGMPLPPNLWSPNH